MLGDIGLWEVLLLGVLALFIFGPERLPKAAAEAGRALRQVRRYALNARRDIEDGFGPEMRDFDITDLNPRSFVRKHLFEDGDDDLEPRQRRATGSRGTASHGNTSRTAPRKSAATANGERRSRGRTQPPPYDTEAT